MIELYAITRHPSPPLPTRSPLTAVAAGRLSLLCGPAIEGRPSPEDLWRREAEVEALIEDRDLLPARYGTRFADEATAARAVEARQDDLLAALERVRGAVELSLRVLGGAPAPPTPGGDDAPDLETGEPPSGTAYIRARAHHDAARREAMRTLHAPLLALARDGVTMPPRPGAELLRAAYLVERDGVERFTARVAELQKGSPDLRLLCTGPWPVYSFTGP